MLLPTKDECGNCVLRLKESMEQTKGVEEVALAERGGTMTISFDPDLLTVRSLEERARDACGVLAERYCHQIDPQDQDAKGMALSGPRSQGKGGKGQRRFVPLRWRNPANGSLRQPPIEQHRT